MVKAHVLFLFWMCALVGVGVVLAGELPAYRSDGSPILLQDEGRHPHIVADTVTFNSSADSTRVTLRTSSTEGRTNIAFTNDSSYVVIATGADSVVNQSGYEFLIWHQSALQGKIHSYIAIGN